MGKVSVMELRTLGRCGLQVSPIGFGAFKIGRNVGIKYAQSYPLPEPHAVDRLLNGALDLGICYIDTAPAYGLSEERIGRSLAVRRDEYVLSSKVGETFEDGRSTYDFSAAAIEASVHRSLERLRTTAIDLLFIHSDGRDLEILEHSDAVPTLLRLKEQGAARAVGFSGKTPEGALAALSWADALMVTYHQTDRSHEEAMRRAAAAGVGVVVKKGLASGRLDAAAAIRFALRQETVASLVIGSLSLEHLKANIAAADSLRGSALTSRAASSPPSTTHVPGFFGESFGMTSFMPTLSRPGSAPISVRLAS